ncbi:MAG: hypothetical protein Q7K29_00515 [Thermoleophilia bacterium]|nr:hypothetical protein [Thermoleophilia bacterium]
MNTTTILPEKEACSNEDRICILYMLKVHADFPIELASISETLRIPLKRVEKAIIDLEGQIDGGDGDGNAYLHKARCSSKAVYIT